MIVGTPLNKSSSPWRNPLIDWNNTDGASVANQVQDAYNGYGQLTAQYQAVAGSVDISSTPAVQYGYSQPSGANYSRQTSMTYPDGRVVDYNYNSGIDTTISRLSSMSDSGGNIESYSYLGLSTIVREIRPGSVLTLVKASGASNGDAGDMYTGLDRFGRVVDQLWVTADTVSSGTGGDTLGTTTEQFEYGYDEDSNVLYQDNMVHSADSELFHANSTTSGDDSTAYDPLNRLTGFRRGTLSSSGNNGSSLDTVTTASGSNSYSLDALGNSSTGGTTFNSKNQITSYGDASITYDYDGNMTTDEEGNTYTYDAWNRMVYAYLPGNPDNPNQYYSYNADNERPGLSVCNGVTTTSYYSTQWQVLEEDATTPSGPCVGATTTVSTYLWSEGYIDDLVARDSSVDGGTVTRIFAQQDANHDITSLVNSSGTVLERFIYDPYGQQTVLSASWASTSDSYDWVYGFQGGRLDPLTGLINFRNRDLNPTLGVWMEQDNLGGYVDGADLYKVMRSNPVRYLDPIGTQATTQPSGDIPKELVDELASTNSETRRYAETELAILLQQMQLDPATVRKNLGDKPAQCGESVPHVFNHIRNELIQEHIAERWQRAHLGPPNFVLAPSPMLSIPDLASNLLGLPFELYSAKQTQMTLNGIADNWNSFTSLLKPDATEVLELDWLDSEKQLLDYISKFYQETSSAGPPCDNDA